MEAFPKYLLQSILKLYNAVAGRGFPRGGQPQRRLRQPNSWHFCHKLHGTGRNWTQRERVSLASPIGSATAMNTGLCNEKIEIHWNCVAICAFQVCLMYCQSLTCKATQFLLLTWKCIKMKPNRQACIDMQNACACYATVTVCPAQYLYLLFVIFVQIFGIKLLVERQIKAWLWRDIKVCGKKWSEKKENCEERILTQKFNRNVFCGGCTKFGWRANFNMR